MGADMQDVKSLISRIADTEFFSRMGCDPDSRDNVIYIRDVFRVFVEPVYSDFHGYYENLEWLPTSPYQDDPFNSFPKPPKKLVSWRIDVTKTVMQSIKVGSTVKFIAGPHDYSLAARDGACFAFRQYISESYYGVSGEWSKVIELYLSGRWPVGYSDTKLIVI